MYIYRERDIHVCMYMYICIERISTHHSCFGGKPASGKPGFEAPRMSQPLFKPTLHNMGSRLHFSNQHSTKWFCLCGRSLLYTRSP